MNRTSYWIPDLGRGAGVSDQPVDREAEALGNSASGASSSARAIDVVKDDEPSAVSIAHDLNNLMSVILGNCGLVVREGLPASSAGRLERIREAGERAVGLASQLLKRKHALE